MLEHGVIPIVNENDTVSVTELMFTDNDELSGLVAAMMDAQMLIILSHIDGIYNGSPSNPASTVIREIKRRDDLPDCIQQTSLSSFGRGGMLTKAGIARKVADEGIGVIIANGKRDRILVDLWAHPESTVCTCFIPSTQPVSSIKKWIAHSAGFAKGEIHVNKPMVEVLYSGKAVSILPVGITRVEGGFEKDDIVRIMDDENNSIGVGKTSYASSQVCAVMGKHGKKAVVHYDYLYLE
jgi:glutamate 5-kinase